MPGESMTVEFILKAEQFSMINRSDARVIEPGWFTVAAGGKQPGLSGTSDPRFTQVLTGRIRFTGREIRLPD